MKSLPEVCDECRRTITVKEKCYVRLSGVVKMAGDLSFRESVAGTWCEDCFAIITPEIDNVYTKS